MGALSQSATTPTAVRAPLGGSVVEIDWADGHTGTIPNERLRGYCPCAGCQGHGSGDLEFISGVDVSIRQIEEVGNYALCFTWGDGHNSGLYRWEFLRGLCACAACLPLFVPRRSP